MMRCESCQPLILDHLYGLLEGPEAAAVESHLHDCASCATARDEAGRVQGLIARAAKKAFPQVRFNPVAKQPKSQVLPLPQPSAHAAEPSHRGSRSTALRRTGRVAVWLPWAVAAAVLVAIPGTVVPVLGVLHRAESTRTTAMAAVTQATTADQEARLAEKSVHQQRERAIRALADARQAHDGLVNRWMADERTALQTVNDRRRMAVDVRKPAAVQPGAPNEFLVTVLSQGNAPRGSIFAEVRDQTDAVIHSQKLDVERRGETHVKLPAQAWTRLTPQSELFLVVASVDEKTGARTELQDRIRLSGPVFATMLTTDKPTYRPGETVFFRSLTLDRVTFKPPAREQLFQYELLCSSKVALRSLTITGGTDLVRVIDGKVEPVRGPDGKPIRGVGTGAIPLPADLDEGDYTLVLHELPHPAGYPPTVPFPVVRPIKVSSGPTDVYQKVIRFAGAGYMPGETVEGWAELKLEEKPVSGATVQVLVTADGAPVEAFPLAPVTGPDGRVIVRFTLPRALERADVRMKVTFHTKNGEEIREESVADRVPVVGRNLIVEFFPEGGNLVAGVPCRVYFRATTPTGVPVDIRGVITDGRNDLVRVETVKDAAIPGANRGIGSFIYTPALGVPVWLKLDGGVFTPLLDGAFPVTPAAVAGVPAVAAVRTRFALPVPQIEGVVMTVPDPVTSPGEVIRVHLRTVGKERNLVVGAYTRGRLSDTQKVTARPDELAEVQLMANHDPRGGVVRITVFEDLPQEQGHPKPDLKPLTERLVFRRPGDSLHLSFTTAGTRVSPDVVGFAPNTPVDLHVAAADEKGNPTAAILWAAAVNTGVAPGPKDRLLTTHFLLAGEISTPDAMEFADFLLTDHPRAAESLDLVLATQGWRRFTEQTPAPLTRWTPPVAPEYAALQASNGQYSTRAEPIVVREHRKLYEVYRPRYEAAKQALDAAEAENAAALADHSGEKRVHELAVRAEHARQEAAASSEQASTATVPLERFQRAGWYGVAGFALLALLLGVVCLGRPVSRLPLGIGTAGSLALVAFLVFALSKAETAQARAAAPQETKEPTAEAPALPVPPAQPVPPLVEGDQANDKVAPPPHALGMGQERLKQPLPPPAGSVKGGPKGGAFGGMPPPGKSPAGGGSFGAAGTGMPQPGKVDPPNVLAKMNDVFPPPGAIAPGGGGLPGRPGGPASAGGFGGAGGGKGGELGNPTPKDLPRPVGVPQPPTVVVPPYAPIGPPRGMPAMPKYPMDGGAGGWSPGGKAKIITDDDFKNSEKNTTRDRHQAPKLSSRMAPAQTGVARVDVYHHDVQILQDHIQRQTIDAVEQMYRALALKYSMPVEQVKEQFSVVVGPAGAKDVPPLFAPPPLPNKPSGFPGRGKDQDADRTLTPVQDRYAFFRVQGAVAGLTPLVVREYAAPRPGSSDTAGYDTPDTILWQPVIVLPSDGKVKLSFCLGAAEGGYQVIIAGHTLDGRLGAVRGLIPIAAPGQSTQPALPGPIPPKMP